MSRPKDYGDRYPSDLDDVAPSSPTEGFSEKDYTVRVDEAQSIPTESTTPFSPDPDEPLIPEPQRNVYVVTVLGWYNPKDEHYRYYWVLRQDGLVGLAHTNKGAAHADYRTGDEAIIIRGPGSDEWILIGDKTPYEKAQIEVYASSSVGGSDEIAIPFDSTEYLLPIDDTFGGHGTFKNFGSGIEVTVDGVYDITYITKVLHAEVVQGSQNEGSSIYIEAGCPDDTMSETDDPGVTGKLVISKNLAPSMRYDPEYCITYLDLGSSAPEHSLLNSAGEGKGAKWTNEPKVGASIKVGLDVKSGWVKIGKKDYSGEVWLSHGGLVGSRVKIRFPKKGPGSACDFLRVSGRSGSPRDASVQLDWLPPGGTGTLVLHRMTGSTLCGYPGYMCEIPTFEPCTLVFKNGLVMSSTCGLSPVSCDGTADGSDSPGTTHDPCNEGAIDD